MCELRVIIDNYQQTIALQLDFMLVTSRHVNNIGFYGGSQPYESFILPLFTYFFVLNSCFHTEFFFF